MEHHHLQEYRMLLAGRIYDKMQSQGIDSLLVTDPAAIRWLTGFSGSSARLLLAGRSAVLFTDFRYREQVRKETAGIDIVITGNSFATELSSGAFPLGLQTALQADHVTWYDMQQLSDRLEGRKFVPVESFFEEFRQVKHHAEIGKLRRAVSISEQVLERVIPMISSSVTELDLAAEISYQHKKLGAEKDSFDPIVASGIRSAMPHARPTAQYLAEGSFVVIDMGCVVDGYASDQTRTVALGKVPEEARNIYRIVRAAQQLGIDAARAGIEAKAVDLEVRSFIASEGYGEAFGHGLGHGVGVEVHEAPRLGSSGTATLQEGMVFTIEPGIYLDGRFGVRIEDMVLLDRDGASPLQGFTKELIEL